VLEAVFSLRIQEQKGQKTSEMFKVAKRQRNGASARVAEDEPSDAVLKPSFTPPPSPAKPTAQAEPSPLSRSSSSSSGSDDDAMCDLHISKRRRLVRRRFVAHSSTQTTRVEAVAAAAVANADGAEEEAGAEDASMTKEPAALNEVVRCPHCGRDVPVMSSTSGFQGRTYTLNDVKRIVSTVLREQDSKLRSEYEKRLQFELQEQRKMLMNMVSQESPSSSKYEYSYIS